MVNTIIHLQQTPTSAVSECTFDTAQCLAIPQIPPTFNYHFEFIFRHHLINLFILFSVVELCLLLAVLVQQRIWCVTVQSVFEEAQHFFKKTNHLNSFKKKISICHLLTEKIQRQSQHRHHLRSAVNHYNCNYRVPWRNYQHEKSTIRHIFSMKPINTKSPIIIVTTSDEHVGYRVADDIQFMCLTGAPPSMEWCPGRSGQCCR